MDLLYKNILFTIAYYNALGYPLTTFEVWRHLFDVSKRRSSASFGDVLNALNSEKFGKYLACENGFWFLKGHERLAKDRIVRQKISLAKIKRARRWIGFFRWIPFLRAVFFTGTLSMKKSGRSSDWDVLVVLKKNYIWLGRLFVTIFFHLAGKRRHDNKIKDRFCLNHFLTKSGLILEEQTEYSASEVSFMTAILGEKTYKKFLQLNEFWVGSFKPNYRKDVIPGKILVPQRLWMKKTKKFVEKILIKTGLAEKLNEAVRALMIKKIKNNPKTYLEGADIRFNDQAIVFLPKPQRGETLKKTANLLTKISG